MSTDRIHRATSNDGTEIAGRVVGEGPPLVLVHAGIGDGDLDCGELASYLNDRFTCYLMSTRNRGLSGGSTDMTPERHLEDHLAFIESIGEPVGVATWSGGAPGVLGAAAHTEAITAVAVFEPLVLEKLDEEDNARLESAVAHMAEQAGQGRLTDAARDWMADGWANEEEMASLEASGYLEAVGRYVPVLLDLIAAVADADGPSPTDPSELARIKAPVLVLQGSETTRRLLVEGVSHVVEHVADARVREVPGAGHSGMLVKPEQTADQLIPFFTESTPA